MEKSTSSATQLTEPSPPPPPPTATSSLPAQVSPLPTSADQRSAELPSPAFTPGTTAQPPSTVSMDPSPQRGRKRALETNLRIENSNYYKMRLLLKDLRPHVLEVLRTPDFRNSKAAFEIQEKMKHMLQLYQEMIGGSPKREKTAKTESLSNGKAISETPQTTTALRSSETSYAQTEKLNTLKYGDKVVGGSAFGWNFITGGGTDPVYCGMSKEDYRSSHPILQAEAEVELHKTL
ncbi:PREDICTED: uncharacterized protein LOC104754333 [Camelina sativa]|uniref:Uncharacterized protein LOC104754333 n=1 Tax=Camelina sativa TaxID=90675 RepID=A0ABM0WQN9_CAMSA|nr:PREDICTED: uncharacterized protein LOC104754333 [Camelina sativa]